MSNKRKKKTSGMSAEKKRLIIVIVLIAAMLSVSIGIMALAGVFNGGDDNEESKGTSDGGSLDWPDGPFDTDGGITLPPVDVEPDEYRPSDK